MKRLLVLLLLFASSPLFAQTQQAIQSTSNFQIAGASSSYILTLKNVAAGDSLVLPFVGNVASIGDSQTNTWTIDRQTAQLSFAHALNAQAGNVIVTVQMVLPGSFTGILSEYPPASAIQVSKIASGNGTAASAPATSVTNPSIAVGFGVNWTSNYLAAPVPSSGFTTVFSQNLTLEDEQGQGSIQAGLTWPQSVSWYMGEAIFTSVAPPPPPPQISTLTLNVQLFNCTTCTLASFSTADWTPLAASSVYQGATLTLYQVSGNSTSLICSAMLNANAQASCSGGINVQPAFLNFTYSVQSPSGQSLVAPGAFSFSAPALSFTSAVSGNVNVWLGFDNTTMAPRFGGVGSS